MRQPPFLSLCTLEQMKRDFPATFRSHGLEAVYEELKELWAEKSDWEKSVEEQERVFE